MANTAMLPKSAGKSFLTALETLQSDFKSIIDRSVSACGDSKEGMIVARMFLKELRQTAEALVRQCTDAEAKLDAIDPKN